MNFFMYWKNQEGIKELLTPPLDGTILPGVTRNSIISLAKSWGVPVREVGIPMKTVVDALKENRVLEMFGAGTAAIVSPIKRIKYGDLELEIPLDMDDSKAQAGPLTSKIADTIMGIQYGEIPHEWSVLIE